MVDQDKIVEQLIEGLNDDQKEAFYSITDFLENSAEHAYVLMGYAGTGKTFLVKRIVMWINATQKRKEIAITAPTNKAVRVLEGMGGFESETVAREKNGLFDLGADFQNSIQYCTIHKLLGLKEVITAKGEQLFQNDRSDRNNIEKYRYLIVDECSMLNDSLCKDLMKYSDKVKIIFMGDPAQIPPVKRDDCIPFREDHPYHFRRATLKKIMRQKGDHPIVDASFLIRNNLKLNQPIPKLETKLNDSGHGIIYYHSQNDRDSIRPMLKRFFDSDEFRADANYAKVIAWRNKIVNYMNKTVRELMYGEDVVTFVEGEKLIVSKPIFNDYGIVFNTSEELTVLGVKVKEKRFGSTFKKDRQLDAKVYELHVEASVVGSDSKIRKHIEVIHEESIPQYKKLLAEAKKRAIDAKPEFRKRLWIQYYAVLKWSADVAYNYAITAHKAQGSTYQNVLIIEEDIDRNPNVVERNRIKYTSYSRPTDKLFILRENYE